MPPFNESMSEYKKQLEKGEIQIAYKGLMDYIMGLKAYLKKHYPDYYLPGGIYYGYMDMTYFSVNPRSLIQRNLKIAIVFIHQAFRFEAWLAGANKQVQQEYWELIKHTGWDKYRLVPSTKGADSILEHILVEHPDFSDLNALTKQIESETLIFIQDIENFLLTLPDKTKEAI
jgi:hypothetical protein